MILRLGYLQVYSGPELLHRALAQRHSPVPLLPNRGTIYDRNGEVLATSFSAEAVYAVPVEVTHPAETAAVLSSILDLDADWIQERLQRKVLDVWIALELDPETARAVREADLPGIYVTERPARFYPYGKLAANVIGFSGIDNQGLEGLEAYYDELLRGVPGMILRERDARGRAIPDGLYSRIEPEDGHNLVLTIDRVLQHIAERELERGVLEAQAELGIFVALDPNTGAVLAMAQYPSYDPNDFASYDPELWKNRAVTDVFEPGSTFKAITGATALEVGVATLDTEYVDPVRLERWGGRVNCWHASGHGRQTFVEAVENSCNPVFAVLSADEIGPERFYNFIRAFGFGQKTGIDFPGEGIGSIPTPKDRLLRWANVGFGQGISTTPIQLAAAIAAIANGGTLYRPYLVSEIQSPDGETVRVIEPQPIRRVLSEETARDFAQVMRSVVVNGSGVQADVEGYRVAGKTGTAQIPEGGRYIDLNMAAFVGFAPADDPVFVGVVMLYKVHATPSWGGMWAGPVFGRIVEASLEYMGIPRRIEQQEVVVDRVRVPNVRNMPEDEAIHILEEAGLHVAFEGIGSYVLDVVPQPGALVDRGSTVLVLFHEEPAPDPVDVQVPRLTGLSMRDAALLLHELGLRIRIHGTGVARSQSHEPGTVVPSGTLIEVYFEPVVESPNP